MLFRLTSATSPSLLAISGSGSAAIELYCFTNRIHLYYARFDSFCLWFPICASIAFKIGQLKNQLKKTLVTYFSGIVVF